MDTLIVTMSFDKSYSENYRKYVVPTQKRYAEENGYEYKLVRDKNNEDRGPTWQKILEVKKEIMNYDYVIWLDADVMIMNHNTDIFSYFDPNSKLTISEDINFQRIEDNNKRVNTGVMIWKGRDEKSEEMLDQIYSDDNFYTKNPYKYFHEQSSLIENIENKNLFKENVTVNSDLGNFWFSNSKNLRLQDILLNKDDPNSNAIRIFRSSNKKKIFLECIKRGLLFEKGDFLVHFAGVENERRELFELFSQHVSWH